MSKDTLDNAQRAKVLARIPMIDISENPVSPQF